MRRTASLLVLIALVSFPLAGCGRAIGEAAELALGPKGTYVPLVPKNQTPPLDQYTKFEVGQIDDDFGGRTPASLLRNLPRQIDLAIADAEIFGEGVSPPAGGKTLLIRGKVLHYEGSGLVATVRGPVEEVVARIDLVAKDSGKLIATANCVGRTTKAVGKGVDKKTQGLARAIAAMIKAGYPEVD